MADDKEGLERAARHLIESFGTGAAKIADQRARRADETQDAGLYGQTWKAIAAKVREIEHRRTAPSEVMPFLEAKS
jgi:hypothetical protein